jgi:hypothetical protein
MSVINPGIGNAIAETASGSIAHLIIDVGGDAGGVMALKQFEPDLLEAGCRLLMIVNPYRPKTSTPGEIARMAVRMEALGGLSVGALVCNSHLMEDTTPADIVSGLDVALEAGKNMNLPVLYATVLPEFYDAVKGLTAGRNVPLWPLVRFMHRPWEGSEMWS